MTDKVVGCFDGCETFSEILVLLHHMAPDQVAAWLAEMALNRKELRRMVSDLNRAGLLHLVEKVEAAAAPGRRSLPASTS